LFVEQRAYNVDESPPVLVDVDACGTPCTH